jgi:hypothetical protein
LITKMTTTLAFSCPRCTASCTATVSLTPPEIKTIEQIECGCDCEEFAFCEGAVDSYHEACENLIFSLPIEEIDTTEPDHPED